MSAVYRIMCDIYPQMWNRLDNRIRIEMIFDSDTSALEAAKKVMENQTGWQLQKIVTIHVEP